MRLALVALCLAACGPSAQSFVWGEPELPDDPAAWARACVYGPDAAPPGGTIDPRGYIVELVARLHKSDGDEQRAIEDDLYESMKRAPDDTIRALHTSLLERIDVLERASGSSADRRDSDCYGALMDVYHAVNFTRDGRTLAR